MVEWYMKKPVKIRAIQYDGENYHECSLFCDKFISLDYDTKEIRIKTLEGEHICSLGDFIIKGIKDEFYPCKPDIFHLTYSLVSDIIE